MQTRTIEGCTTSELIIDDVELEDAGTYSVVVENAAGSDICEATLNVYGKRRNRNIHKALITVTLISL